MNVRHLLVFAAWFAMTLPAAVQGQMPEVNYDESRVPAYTLPDPLVMADGQPVTSAEQWRTKRRPEIVALFEEHMFGRAPGKPENQKFVLIEEDRAALGGRAVRKQIAVLPTGNPDEARWDLLIYLPTGGTKHPVFVGLNFGGNQAVHTDPAILITRSWTRDGEGYEHHCATEASRGKNASRWPIEQILQRGYGVATMYYGDIDPDYDDGFQNGIHRLFYREGQQHPEPNEWGSIAAWAWGLSRVMDYLETDADVDAQRVALMGHSRLGKTALWAGALDERFRLVISNNSGCGGAALSRREFGETVRRINTVFPHWFNDNFVTYNDRVNELPIDQHMLIALQAPRAALVCSAEEDRWADPRGEFLATLGADPVYRLLDTDGLAAKEMPGLNEFIGSRLSYHIRPGAHDVTPDDWRVYMDFADLHLKP